MQRKVMAMLLLMGGFSLECMAQTPFEKAFADMHSSDPAMVNKARMSMALLAEQEMPTIEKDTATLCDALADPDAMIRLQASGILSTITLIAHEHNQVVVSCFPQLIAAASDPADRVRNNSLFALAMNPAGPPPQAHDVFVKSLQSSNFRTAEVGAAGLLKEGTNAQANQSLVKKALDEAPDAKHKLNILYAISGSRVPSDDLFQASQKYLSDADPSVQQEAINAVVATATDKSKAITIMQNLEDSSSASMQQKKQAQAMLNSLNTSH
jgi:HEAT repeat protein